MIEFCFETINWSPYLAGAQAGPLPGLDRLSRAAAEAGYRWISFDQPILDVYEAEGGQLSELRKRLDDFGIEVLAIHSVAIDEDVAAIREACSELTRSIEVLGARYLHAGATASPGPAAFEATAVAAEVAQGAGARLSIEFLPFLAVASIDQTRALIRGGAPEAQLVVDAWHFFFGPDDWAELESVEADEIAYVQFDDHPTLSSDDLLAETTQNRVYPGEGEFDLERFARVLRTSGFEGVVGLELLSAAHRGLPVEQVARELLSTSTRYWR